LTADRNHKQTFSPPLAIKIKLQKCSSPSAESKNTATQMPHTMTEAVKVDHWASVRVVCNFLMTGRCNYVNRSVITMMIRKLQNINLLIVENLPGKHESWKGKQPGKNSWEIPSGVERVRENRKLLHQRKVSSLSFMFF